MNRSYQIIPVYTGDVSGVASSLFELGGMVVIHDPSGCNSTYNTHDETRWYDQDSLIYITGLSQTDAIMGDDEKMIREVCEAAEQLSPAFIALTSSPIPYMNGTDFPAIARLITQKTGIPSFFVPANGMHDYVYGAGHAFLNVAEHLVDSSLSKKKNGRNLNLLGVTPLDFSAKGSVRSLRKTMEEYHWTVLSCWAMEESPDKIRMAAAADVNLVVSASGYRAALLLEQEYGIPWVAGIPTGKFTDMLMQALEKTAVDGKSRIPYLERNEIGSEEKELYLIGEPITMGSLAAAVQIEMNYSCHVICPVEADDRLTGRLDYRTDGEEATEKLLQDASEVIADPLYRPICRKNVILHELPHQAFSGRCFRKQMKNLIELPIEEFLNRGN